MSTDVKTKLHPLFTQVKDLKSGNGKGTIIRYNKVEKGFFNNKNYPYLVAYENEELELAAHEDLEVIEEE